MYSHLVFLVTVRMAFEPNQIPHLILVGSADYMYLNLPGTCFLKTKAPPEVAILTEPFTIGVHAVMRGGIKIGDTVVI